jgi:YidC/Oxa1 family membrane protein insertase
MTPVIANVLQPLINAAHAVLRFFHDDVGMSWGFSIIFLTFTVRLIILPLTFKQVRSMQALQRLAPEMQRIKERYKDDKQRQQEEIMRFYQEHKVNPFGSCLPLLLQFPVFISLFYLLRGPEFKADIAGEASFGFIPNLAEPVTGHPALLVTLLVLYIGTQLGASAVTAISADRNQRLLMFGLPLFFGFFVIPRFQAGLIVYWITTNVWTIGQQLVVKKFLPPPEPLPPKGGGDDKQGSQARPLPQGARAISPSASGDGSGSPADGGNGASARGAPPPPPRKRKKRSGRRR